MGAVSTGPLFKSSRPHHQYFLLYEKVYEKFLLVESWIFAAIYEDLVYRGAIFIT